MLEPGNLTSVDSGDDARWQAVLRRDPRVDGIFVYAVRTTGIYCRPVCGAPRPKRENARFFACGKAAEAAGFRACRLCRPERLEGGAGPDVSILPTPILFADVKGFTRLAADLAPDAALGLLDLLQDRLAALVDEEGGIVHRQLGDGIMAVFGAAAGRRGDAGSALACALAIARSDWPAAAASLGIAAPALRFGVGLHLGPLAVRHGPRPSFGGDAVNVASRLERASRRLRAGLVASDALVRSLRDPADARDLLPVGPTRLNGAAARRVWVLPEAAAPSLARAA